MKLSPSLFALTISLISHFTYAGPVEWYYKNSQLEQTPLLADKTITPADFKQFIDHKHPERGFFDQRYYVDETYGPSDESPVLFYICGEAACTKRALNGAIRTYAKKIRAKMVALEHRYYGESMPVLTFSTNALQLLTTEQALDDLAYFEHQTKLVRDWHGKWIAIGGSYPGSLSAYYRLKYPYMVVGALASSAPVMAKEDFIEYDAHVTNVAGPECAKQIRQVVSLMERNLDNPKEFNHIKALFDASEILDPVDFLYLVADTAAAAVQYGDRDTFCTSLATADSPLDGYATFAKNLYSAWGVSPVELTAQGAVSENPLDYRNGVGLRQWYYQSCTEYGYWQNAHPDPALSTRSSLINMDYHRSICQRLFGLSRPANTEAINQNYYYPLQEESVSRIYFTNGEQDPWSNLSMAERNGNATNPRLAYYLIEDAAHCDDLRAPSNTDQESLKIARSIMNSLLIDWVSGPTPLLPEIGVR